MDIARQKLDLIEWISKVRDPRLLRQLADFKHQQPNTEPTTGRHAGWGRDIFGHVADEHLDAIPPGFEEYLTA